MSASTLRILVDLTHLYPRGEGGGIKPALEHLFRWLGQQAAQPLQFVFLVNPTLGSDISGWLRPVDRFIPADQAPPDVAVRENCQLVYCPFGLTDWACPGIPTVSLVVDLLHRDFPESLSEEEQHQRTLSFQTTVERTDLFQVISDYTAGQLRRHYQVPVDQIIRTHLPVHDRLALPGASPRAEHGRTYFFYPANAWAHKNHEPLLMAYALYRRAAGPDAWRLVLTGYRNAAMQRLQGIADTLDLSDHVDFLGYVDEARLATLWSGAGALVFPSLHEGFGIPLLEAMAFDVPIVASDSTAIPEIVADAALLVKGRAPVELAQAMQQLAASADLRRRLTTRGRQRLADFSVEGEYTRLLDGFRRAAASPARFRQRGYYAVDGLIDPVAFFAPPSSPTPLTLSYTIRPLGVARTLEIGFGSQCLATIQVAADRPSEGEVVVPAKVPLLTLRVPDASRLSPTDSRTHGVLLQRLIVQAADGTVTDLLANRTP